ncbi:hypothetical protein PM10SUCC1_36180 [Propionigenium maris DSM 9537]|uniref:Uncharacterized protein n=1 Tax=Propionigenium maris DSM 9537 TaxID=1123000 RepID=A0A9W6GN41_9FUSO|nr:OadG family protein [Propionigenium maris]GLI58104.1 hypothetical protein PM10SUCC1_36180 [Propionigenium maris DSM 9537]
MTINEIMEIFSNPETIHSLSFGEKLLGVGFTMVLGMGITFISLVILKGVMEVMTRVLVEKKKPVAVAETAATPPQTEVQEVEEPHNDEAVIAAITVALSAKLKTPMSNIVIRNIRKVGGSKNSWNHVGIIEQMNSRL